MEQSKNEFMAHALKEAEKAYNCGEVPVGCVIVKDGTVIGTGRNECESKADSTAHAEIQAIREASQTLGDWRLDGCTMYVTMEPCPMCAGAIINSRIDGLVFGVRDSQKGSVGSVVDLFSENYGRRIKVYPNVLENECKMLLKKFFEDIRQ